MKKKKLWIISYAFNHSQAYYYCALSHKSDSDPVESPFFFLTLSSSSHKYFVGTVASVSLVWLFVGRQQQQFYHGRNPIFEVFKQKLLRKTSIRNHSEPSVAADILIFPFIRFNDTSLKKRVLTADGACVNADRR